MKDVSDHAERYAALRRRVTGQYPELAEREDLLALLERVPRERFAENYAVLGELDFKSFNGTESHWDEVLRDTPLVLAYDGIGLPASTISAPSIVLKFISMLDLHANHHVTEIGSGSGWMAALMAQIVGPRGRVTGIEILPNVAIAAKARSDKFGPAHLDLCHGDFSDVLPGLPQQDRIVATAAFDRVPQVILDALAPDGLLLLPVTIGHAINASLLINSLGEVVDQVPTLFVPATGNFGIPPLLPDWQRVTGLDHPGTHDARLSSLINCLSDTGFGFRTFVAATEAGGFFSRRPDPTTGRSVPGWAYGIIFSDGALTVTDREGVFVSGDRTAAAEELNRIIARWEHVLRPGPDELKIELGELSECNTARALRTVVDIQ